VATPPVDSAVAARADAPAYLLRVALDPTCFADPARFPADCQWLDSQSAIEGQLPESSITKGEFALNCELVTLNGQAVPNP
jgi:hypothetical protein